MTNCTNAPPTVPSDSGVAGIGVLLSFIITAVIALGISASLIFQEARGRSSAAPKKPSMLRRKLLNAYSDQQILTGIGIQGVGLAKVGSMVPYHFFIIWMLSLLSMAVHNASLLALVHDFRRDWVLRWLRQFLIFVHLALSSLYGILVLRAVGDGINDATFPVACVFHGTDGSGRAAAPGGNRAVSYIGTIVVVAGNAVVFVLATWYLHSRTQRFYKPIQVVGLLLMTAIAVGAVVRVSLLADALGADHPLALGDAGERQWSFGQLLSVGMLLLPVVSIIEILRGEIRCAPPVADRGDDKGRLLGGDELHSYPEDRASFQPNPYFGSRTSFFIKK